MRCLLRFSFPALTMALCLTLSASCFAYYTHDDQLPSAQQLAQMVQRAQQASPRDQCFLYTQLIHTMTEIAGQEMLAGETEKAASTFQQIQHYAAMLQAGLARNAKHLMNAQMLMHNTTRQLQEYVRRSSFEDREPMEATLKQLTKVEDQLLNQVFAQ